MREIAALPIVELGLGATVWLTALAFGGTYAPLLSVAQLVILGLGVLMLFSESQSPLNLTQAPRIVPLVLVAIMLLQILPLPASVAPVLGARDSVFPERRYFTLSFAPYQTVSHLLLLVTYGTAFGLTLVISRDRGARRRFIYALLALGVFEALYGLVQYMTGWQQIFTYVKKYYLEDATGTYINHNHFAGLLEMVLPFAVAFGIERLRALPRATVHGPGRWRAIFCAAESAPVVFMAALCVILLTALVFSRSRMGLIATLVSLVMIYTCSAAPFNLYKLRPILLTALLLAVAGLVVWIGSAPVASHFEELGSEYSLDRDNRFSIWSDTLRLIHHHPLLGTGLGTFSIAYPAVQTAFLTYRVDHAHCDYLEIASDVGVPGAALIFGSIVWVLVQVVQRARSARARCDDVVQIGCIGSISAMLVHSLVDFNLYIPANALVFVVVIALAWSLLHNEAHDTREDPKEVGFCMTTAKRVLVAGAGGFVGHHLVKRLKAEGYWVRGTDIKQSEFEPSPADEFEVLDLRCLENALKATRGITQVYNLAADMGGIGYISSKLADIARNNVLISAQMLEASRIQGVERFLFSSSACVYAADKQDQPNVIGLREEDAYPADPEPGYGWEKLFSEQLCSYYFRDFRFETRIVRFHNVYGPLSTYEGGREKAPVAICCKVALASENGHVDVWGDGEQSRSFMYVSDCVEGMLRLMASNYREPLNLGSEEMVSVNELVDIVCDIAGKNLVKRHDLSKPQGVRGRNSDNTRLRSVLGWEPQIRLRDGLKLTYAWIEQELRRTGRLPRIPAAQANYSPSTSFESRKITLVS